MRRRRFIKVLGGTSALLYFNSCALTQKAANGKELPLFSFLFCNDIHVTTQEQADYFGASIDNWRGFSDLYDFVVVCGDLANNGTVEEHQRVMDHLKNLNTPCYTVLGNHDVTKPGKDGKKGYEQVFGANRLNYYEIHKNTALIFLDLTDGMSANVEIKKDTRAWLSAALKEIPKRMPIILFSHFPLHPNIPRFKVLGASKLFNILDRRNVQACFSGHYHAPWQGERNGVPFFTNTCLSLKRDNHDNSPQEGFLLVDVYNKGIETAFFARGTRPENITG